MPANKKPRKKATPRKALMRPITIGLDSAGARALKLLPHTEFEKMRKGDGTKDAWNTVTARLNLSMVMATTHEWGQLLDVQAKAALEAMVSVRDRAERTGKYGLTGDEMKTVGFALNAADEMEDCLTRRELLACHKLMLASPAYSSNGST